VPDGLHIHLDAIGGVAGDMFVAAVLDAWPEWQPELFAALQHCGLPAGWQPQLEEVRQHAIRGLHFSVLAPGHIHTGETPHPSGSFRDIRAGLMRSHLEAEVKRHAVGIFALLAEAEGAVHGIPPDEVHFHEIADWDSLADIVAAAWLMARAGARSWSVSTLPLGNGTVRTAHGTLPVPAPATARLLEGFDVIDDGLPGERVTPTGAAILRHLQPVPRPGVGGGRLSRSGYGLGTRQLPDRANVLRLLALEMDVTRAGTPAEQIAVVVFDIDDQSGEDLAVALEHLRALAGVTDVTCAPVFGKKGRIVQRVQILSAPEALGAVCERSFLETTTLGLRWRVEWRQVLARTQISGQDGVRVKRAERPGGLVTAKAEIDDLDGFASHAERQRRRAQAESAALDGGQQ
jgi:pyridinium-3,5-bisthiocarboxylic acid mononucleotide nickel chelatase